jgi:cephalosporin hydroxylase
VIVETGVYDGGSTLLFAGLCRLQAHGRVISVELDFRPGVREAIQDAAADMGTLVEGDASLPETAARV